MQKSFELTQIPRQEGAIDPGLDEGPEPKLSLVESVAVSNTSEQLAVINHPGGRHALVLAGPGTGKSTTIAEFARKRILVDGADPRSFAILVFNRHARFDLQRKIKKLLPRGRQPAVQTFHSYGLSVVNRAIELGHLPAQQQWLQGEERALRLLRQVVQQVAHQVGHDGQVDLPDLYQVINLFKETSIAPANAGYQGNEILADIYRAFEAARQQVPAITFADLVPLAVALLDRSEQLREEFVARCRVVVVDEAQDLNPIRIELVRRLSSGGAEVMLVGDVDQTINEWNGSRPQYVARDFEATFPDVVRYGLTHSFRFGPAIATAAQVVIARNRCGLPVIASDPAKETRVDAVTGTCAAHVNKVLVDNAVALVRDSGVAPAEIRVLGRCYAQLAGIALELNVRRIPYRVDGDNPLAQHPVIRALLAYPLIAAALKSEPTPGLVSMVKDISQVPTSYIPFASIDRVMRENRLVSAALCRLEAAVGRRTVPNVIRMLDVLERDPSRPAGEYFAWLVEALDIEAYLNNYLGRHQASEERKQIVRALVDHAKAVNETAIEFADRLLSSDTTQGQPKGSVLVLSTIHRTKGLDWDYVIIPDAIEGMMPVTYDNSLGVYDRRSGAPPPLTSSEESERRLFHVGITRARKGLVIGAPDDGSLLAASRFLAEAQFEAAMRLASTVSDADVFLDSVRRLRNGREAAQVAFDNYVRPISTAAQCRAVAAAIKRLKPATEVKALPAALPAGWEDVQ